MHHLNDFVESWSAWLIHSGWQAGIVVSIAAIMLLLLRRASAQLRYAILLIALVKFAAPPFLSLSVGLFSQSRLAVAVSFNTEVTPLADFVDGDGSTDTSLMAQETNRSVPSAAQETPVAVDQSKSFQKAKTANGPNFQWPVIVMLLIHAAGCVVAVYFIGRQYRLLSKIVGNSTAAPTEITQLTHGAAHTLGMKSIPRVLVSEESDAPFAMGLLKPIILLPQCMLDLPTDQLRIILGHELAHVRRRDLTIGWLETVLSVVWWFHPGMWWLKRALRRTREDCCDDILLTSQLAVPARYCETLIQAAARQTFRPLEPIALGFSNGEHPAARRIRRLMDSSLFRTHRLGKSAVVLTLVLGLFLLPGMRPEKAPVVETSLEGSFGWRNLSFDPSADELAIVEECRHFVMQYRSTYGKNGKKVRRFDDLETRDGLEDLLKRKPNFFYTEHLLGTWYRRNGDLKKAHELFTASMKNAPIVLTQRYRAGNKEPLSGVTIEGMSIECNRVKNHSLNPNLQLEFIDLITDNRGEVTVPVYDTVYRLSSRSYPSGYDTEMPRLGHFSTKSRIGVLPEITAWRSSSQPHDFTRTAADSALLANANGTTTNEIVSDSNRYLIGRIARCQQDGHFTESLLGDSSSLPTLPQVTNAAYMDHVIIDLASPAPDRFEIDRVTVLDSRTKIPLSSFQTAAGVTLSDNTRFHLYSLHENLPDEVDLVLSVANYEVNAFRMIIPVEPKGTWKADGVTFVTNYLEAGQHPGWSSQDGFYKEAKALDFVAEMLCQIDSPSDQRFSLIVVTDDRQRIRLDHFSHPYVRIPKPLHEIDHFELVSNMPAKTIYFEKLALPPRTDNLSQQLPTITFQLTGAPETASTDILSPMILRCMTRQGDVYDGSVGSGEFGFELHEKEVEQWHPESRSTVTISAIGPSAIKLSPKVLSRQNATELKSERANGMSGGYGSVLSTSLPVPLSDVGTVEVAISVAAG